MMKRAAAIALAVALVGGSFGAGSYVSTHYGAVAQASETESESETEGTEASTVATASAADGTTYSVQEIVANAMRENNDALTTHVEERILKEMNYLMRTQDEREEERYKKLDMAMRSKQKLSRREKRQQLKTEKLLLKKTKKEEQRLKQEKQKKLAAEKKKGDLKIRKKAPAQQVAIK